MTTTGGGIERALGRGNGPVIAALVLIIVLAWLYLLVLAAQMAGGDMSLMGMDVPGAGATDPMAAMAGAVTHAPQPWTAATFVLMALMWWIMMIGMMVPAAAPMILLFARVQRHRLAGENPGRRIALFTFGYLLAWAGFSIAATAAQWWLGTLALITPTMESASPVLPSVLFALAGIYQITPIKRACLAHCRAPVDFLSRNWRKGDIGALAMGVHHGAYCVGCCWFLMALLFVGGVMNLLWVAAIAIFVILEKLLPRGEWIARITGFAMLVFAVFLAGRAL